MDRTTSEKAKEPKACQRLRQSQRGDSPSHMHPPVHDAGTAGSAGWDRAIEKANWSNTLAHLSKGSATVADSVRPQEPRQHPVNGCE